MLMVWWKAEDWYDEDDDCTSPRVQNPKHDDVAGCGSCKALMKKESEYKGK